MKDDIPEATLKNCMRSNAKPEESNLLRFQTFNSPNIRIILGFKILIPTYYLSAFLPFIRYGTLNLITS